MDVGHLAPEIALVVGAVVVVLVASFARRPTSGSPLPLAIVVAAGRRPGTASDWPAAPTSSCRFDRAVGARRRHPGRPSSSSRPPPWRVLLLSVEWFRTDPRRGEYPAILLFSAAGAMVLAGAADTMELVVGMLLVSVTGYTLAAYHRGSPPRVEAGMKYFLVGALDQRRAAGRRRAPLRRRPDRPPGRHRRRPRRRADRVALVAAVVCLVVGLAFEIGAVPAHVWVPDVAQARPGPLGGVPHRRAQGRRPGRPGPGARRSCPRTWSAGDRSSRCSPRSP